MLEAYNKIRQIEAETGKVLLGEAGLEYATDWRETVRQSKERSKLH